MKDRSTQDHCSNLTQEMTVSIPCRLAVRVENFARENQTTVAGVLIEALDHLLRSHQPE